MLCVWAAFFLSADAVAAGGAATAAEALEAPFLLDILLNVYMKGLRKEAVDGLLPKGIFE